MVYVHQDPFISYIYRWKWSHSKFDESQYCIFEFDIAHYSIDLGELEILHPISEISSYRQCMLSYIGSALDSKEFRLMKLRKLRESI
jgi:hypothetical protein